MKRTRGNIRAAALALGVVVVASILPPGLFVPAHAGALAVVFATVATAQPPGYVDPLNISRAQAAAAAAGARGNGGDKTPPELAPVVVQSKRPLSAASSETIRARDYELRRAAMR